MKRKRTPTAEELDQVRQEAMRRRVEAGLPAIDPDDTAAEEAAKALGGKYAVDPSGRARFIPAKKARKRRA